jgi:hypothetical protein
MGQHFPIHPLKLKCVVLGCPLVTCICTRSCENLLGGSKVELGDGDMRACAHTHTHTEQSSKPFNPPPPPLWAKNSISALPEIVSRPIPWWFLKIGHAYLLPQFSIHHSQPSYQLLMWYIVKVSPEELISNTHLSWNCSLSITVWWYEWHTKLRSFNCSLLLLMCSLIPGCLDCVCCVASQTKHVSKIQSVSIPKWKGEKAHTQLNLLEGTNPNYWTAHCILFQMLNAEKIPEIQ